jgi:HK97 family phage major capsid protein
MTAPLAPPEAPAPPPEQSGAMTVEELAAAIQAILDEAVGEGRDLTDDEMARAEDLERRLVKRRRQDALAGRHVERVAPVNAGLMGMIQVTPRADDTLERAFGAYLRSGRENQDITHLRAQGEGTGPAGGYTVPPGFRQKLVERMVAFGGIQAAAEQITTTTGEVIQWPTIDDTANSGEVVSEGGTHSAQADLVFGSANLGAYMYMTGGGSVTPLRLSVQLLQDSAFDLEGKVAQWLGTRLARASAAHMVNGNGVQQPQGIAHGLTGVEIAADTAGVTYDDLINFIHSVDPAYRELGNCSWGFNDTMWATIRKLKDSNDDPIWRPRDATIATGADGQPANARPVLLDYPVVIDQAFPTMTAASNTINWGVFGDLREGYVVRRVRDVVVVVNPWTRAANAEVEYTAYTRLDAARQNTNAYKALTGEA